LAEYREVLARKKFNLPDQLLKEWYSVIDQFTILHQASHSIKFDRDPNPAFRDPNPFSLLKW
jgi:hypothetical protein